MQLDEIKKKREIAWEAVKDMQDEGVRQKAFEVILSHLLQEKSTKTPNEVKSQTTDEDIELNTKKLNPENLAHELNVEMDRLNAIIDFSPDEFHIIVAIPGGNHKEQQRNAALLIMTTNFYCSDEREISAKKLAATMRDKGIKSLPNLALNLKNFENFIVKKGEQGDPRTRYRITDPGLSRGLELMRELMA